MSQSGWALLLSCVSAVALIFTGLVGLAGVRRTATVTADVALRGDLLKEREQLKSRVDDLERRQREDRQTIHDQRDLIDQQEDRIGNQNRTIQALNRRMSQLERLLRRNKIPVPNGEEPTDPNLARQT